MKKIIIASDNPTKIESTRRAFMSVFPNDELIFEGVPSESGVSAQPMTDEETLLGARNRVLAVKALHPHADFWVGLEGGVDDIMGELHQFSWTYICSADGREGKGRSATYIAPGIYRKMLIEDGMEIGQVGDTIFKMQNSKQGSGASGLLTNDIIDRVELDRHATIFALIPFIKPDLYC